MNLTVTVTPSNSSTPFRNVVTMPSQEGMLQYNKLLLEIASYSYMGKTPKPEIFKMQMRWPLDVIFHNCFILVFMCAIWILDSCTHSEALLWNSTAAGTKIIGGNLESCKLTIRVQYLCMNKCKPLVYAIPTYSHLCTVSASVYSGYFLSTYSCGIRILSAMGNAIRLFLM